MAGQDKAYADRLVEAHELLVSEFARRKAVAEENGEGIIAREWQEEIDAADKAMHDVCDAEAAACTIDEWLSRYANLSEN